VAVFELNARANPGSWLAHNSLARAYVAVGRRAEAIGEYERALKIDPRSSLSITGLDRLRRESP
jgi:Flp pilus assembly protein TadD